MESQAKNNGCFNRGCNKGYGGKLTGSEMF